MDKAFYFDKLYPLQDRMIATLSAVDTEFYLSGGTAASRGYLNHRFSDDLDFFVDDDARFVVWADRLVQALRKNPGWGLEVLLKEERFVRVVLHEGEVSLKVPFTNFILDTTLTLLGRMYKGETWYRSHRSHYYQRMTGLGMSHAKVTGLEMLFVVLSCVAAILCLRLGFGGRIAVASSIAVVIAIGMFKVKRMEKVLKPSSPGSVAPSSNSSTPW